MTRPPRVLFVNRMASMVRGGGETFDLEIARHLAKLGCHVTFLTGLPLLGRAKLGPADWWGEGKDPKSEVRISNCGCSVSDSEDRISNGGSPISDFGFRISSFRIRTPYLGWFPWDKVRGGWRVRWADFVMFEKAAAAWAWKRRGDFDVIQVCELVTFVHEWKRLASHSSIAPSPHSSAPPVVMRLTAPDFHDPHGALAAADAVIASGTTMQKMREGARPDCVNIQNGVDTEWFRPHPTSFRREQGWADDDRIVLFVARFQAVKNHAMLVEAFRAVAQAEPKARLVLAGSGPLESDIRSRCAQGGLQDRVTFLGEVPFRRVADLYAAADVNVISSDYESFSFAVLEGMASGLPHVVTATQWVPTLIGGTSAQPGACPGGMVVPVGDARAFADAVRQLLLDVDLRRSMGAWNRERVVKEFGWAASAEKLIRVYRGLMEQGRSVGEYSNAS